MGTVFYLPGILGTELGYPGPAPAAAVYWPDPKTLAGNFCRDLTLDGTVNGNPSQGVNPVTPGRLVPSHYQRAVDSLSSDLLGTAYQQVIPWGYDWRNSILQNGLLLANAIERSVVDDCVIVGHSMGGLIARLAYKELVRLSKSNLVKRIITMGSPHRGSARIISALNGDFGEGYGYVFKSSIFNLVPGGQLATAVLQSQILTMMASWPGFCELLPMIENDGSDADVGRKGAFTVTGYEGGGTLFPALLANARDVTHPALRDGASIPAGKKLVCIVGTGYPTPYVSGGFSIDLGGVFGVRNGPATISKDGAGDGTVTETSAFVTGSELITVECSHDALPRFCSESGMLAPLILETVTGSDTTPPAPASPPMEVAPAYVAPPLVPPPPPEPPKQKARGWRGGRGRPIVSK